MSKSSDNQKAAQTQKDVPIEIQAKVRHFFEVYDPQRLESSDFNVLLKYILTRGLPALEEKLLKKYGVNIQSMEEVNRKHSTSQRKKSNLREKEAEMENEVNDVPQKEDKVDDKKEATKGDGEEVKILEANGLSNVKSKGKKPESDEIPPPEDDPPPLPDLPSDRVDRQVENDGSVRTQELTELDNLPVAPPRPGQSKKEKRKQEIKSLQQAGGINPDSQHQEDPERAELFARLTEYYKKHNRVKLLEGIGDVVEYALRRGEARINQKLNETYGEDLYTFEKNLKNGRITSENHEHLEMKKEEAVVTKMEPKRQELRQKLIDFFLAVEPPRAELRMDPLLDYAEKNGVAKLNQKLFNKYGFNLDNFHMMGAYGSPRPNSPSRPALESNSKNFSFNQMRKEPKLDADLKTMKKGDLPDYVRLMLGRFYAKYDQTMLAEGGVDAVYDWTKRNGLEKLNKKLYERYGQSLQEFITMANELRDDLIEFYRHRDKNKLVLGIQPILDWGLRNGRTALNAKLRSKYGVDLELDIYQENMESASQF